MIHHIALTTLFGLPLVVYGGLTTLFLILSTAAVGYLNFRGNHFIPFKWHPVLALTTIVVAIIHGFLGLSIFLGF
jgi:hypothetical protein